MLVITRRENEALIIKNKTTGETIRIEMLKCNHSRGKLGIDASETYDIQREELKEN